MHQFFNEGTLLIFFSFGFIFPLESSSINVSIFKLVQKLFLLFKEIDIPLTYSTIPVESLLRNLVIKLLLNLLLVLFDIVVSKLELLFAVVLLSLVLVHFSGVELDSFLLGYWYFSFT